MKKWLFAVAAVSALALPALAQAGPGGPMCPARVLALTANPIGPAVTAALAQDAPKNRPQVTGAVVASTDVQRGPEVTRACGAAMRAKTVVVYITDRAFLPSASLSERVVFVDRTPAGYHVWLREH